MQYLDSTARSGSAALGHWLNQEAPSEQAHLRIKTGYFALSGLGALKASIDHLVQNKLPISIVLGANEKATIKADVDALYALIGCPRPHAKLCVVSCSGGLFHPKVVHLTRTDGSELAYVGSANLTSAGVNGTNIEAGLLLDSRKGDSPSILQEIAASIDEWFKASAAGVTQIASLATTQQLVDEGVLGLASPPSTNATGNPTGSPQATNKMPLKALVQFPSLTTKPQNQAAAGTPTIGTSPAAGIALSAAGGQDVLVAEIGGGPRWKQANFPIGMIKSFFGVNPTANDYVDLFSVATNGAQSAPVHTQVVNVKSQNYRIELASVSGLPYPTNGRPIGVFRKIGHKMFRHRIFLPGDVGYTSLDSALKAQYVGPSHHLKRIQISQSALNAIWPACPV